MDERTLHVASGGGGGMFVGSTCGTISAAMMIVGLMETKGNAHQTPSLKFKLEKMLRAFETDMGSLLCKDLRPVYFENQQCLPLLIRTAEMLDNYYLEFQKATGAGEEQR